MLENGRSEEENQNSEVSVKKRIFGKVLIVLKDQSCLKSYRKGTRVIMSASYIYIKFLFSYF